jgi:lysophospholipase L1-like esterase
MSIYGWNCRTSQADLCLVKNAGETALLPVSVPGVKTEQGNSEKADPWLGITLNCAIFVSFLVTVNAYALGRWEVFLGPIHFTVSRGLKPVFVLLLFALLRWIVAIRGKRFGGDLRAVVSSPWFNRPALALASLLLFFAVLEGILRLVDFQVELPKIVIRGENQINEALTSAFIPDPELKYRLNPGAEFNGRVVNSMGFLDREVDPVKKKDVFRVICMGDSCTGQGIPPYSGFLHELLQENSPTSNSWESFNMGVHGYSSAQGLRLFQIRGAELKPDFVSIYYGWNDHWLGGKPDSNSMGLGMSANQADLFETFQEVRSFQLIVYLMNPVRRIAVKEKKLGLRVPPDEFVWTLKKFIQEVRSLDAVPILITAPRAEKLTTLLLRNKQARDMDEVTRIHDEYCDLARQVSGEESVPLLDLAAAFAGPEKAHLFSDDGIHLQREGRKQVARLLYEKLVELSAGK